MSREYIPRVFQDTIQDHIIDVPRCAVFAQPGSGKTIATLSALDTLAHCEPVWPALVISTKRVARSVWPDEAAEWQETEHLKVAAVVGTQKQRIAAARTRAHIHTVNFDNVPWLVQKWGTAWPYKTLIVDESTKLAGYRLRQGKARARYIASIAWRDVHRFIELTGTPTTNGLHKLWGPTYFLDRGAALGHSFAAFEDRYFYRGRDGYSLKAFPGSLERCVEAMKHLAVSINTADHFDLLPAIEIEIPVKLPDAVMRQYRKFEREYLIQINDETISSPDARAKSGKLLQLTSGAVYPDREGDDGSPLVTRKPGDWLLIHDEKIDALRGLIDELHGAPLLVAYWWRSDLERLLAAFPDARRLDDDPETVKAWNRGEIPVLLANPASAGHGLSLQHGGNAIAFFSQWWDAELYQQIIDRIGPMRQFQSGYGRRVFVYHITATGTIDQTVTNRTGQRIFDDKRFMQGIARL